MIWLRMLYVPSGGLTLSVGIQKWGFSWIVHKRPPADIIPNESLLPTTPPPRGHHVYGRHCHGSPVKNRWRFSKFCKKYETLSVTLKICTLQENGFEELKLALFESLFLELHLLFSKKNWSDHLLKHSKAMNEPHKAFKWPWKFKVLLASSISFSCGPPWKRVTLKFWELLKNASKVTSVPKSIFSVKIFNYSRSFLECKVSLADGIRIYTQTLISRRRKLAGPRSIQLSLRRAERTVLSAGE